MPLPSRTTPSSATLHTAAWSAATARSTGCACPGSTRRPASRGSSVATTRVLAGGPGRRRHGHHRARYRTTPWCSRPEFDSRTGRSGSSTACPSARTNPEVVRVVEGVPAASTCAMDLPIRFGYGQIVPWVRTSRQLRPSPDPTPWPCGRRCNARARTCHRRRVHRARGRADALRRSPGSPRTWSRPGRPTPGSPSRTPTSGGRLGRRTALSRDDVPRGLMRSLITLKALTYQPDRRHRRRRHHLAARGPRRRAQLGLPLLLAARRHPDPRRRSCAAGTTTRPWPGATGCCAPWPGTRPSCRSCTAPPASGGSTSGRSTGSPATRAPSRCASATPPPGSTSSTCTARSCRRCTRRARPAAARRSRPGTSSAR